MDTNWTTTATAGISAALGLGLMAGGYAYASLWPGSRIFGSALIAPRKPDQLALTFDDGPNAAFTPRLLDALAAHGVHANFFIMGLHAQLEPGLVRRAHSEGHLIGIHSWTHPNYSRIRGRRIEEELQRSREELQQITGSPVRFHRPPFGARRPAVFRIARQMGLTTVLWNAMTSDWAEPSTDKIVARLQKKIDCLNRHGRAANIVLHDGGHLDPAVNREPSITAADRLVAHYKPTHRFVRLDEWA
jgi:peptidoglycan/xylan/chitin deacetylase (PgdA/CDA1 family)